MPMKKKITLTVMYVKIASRSSTSGLWKFGQICRWDGYGRM